MRKIIMRLYLLIIVVFVFSIGVYAKITLPSFSSSSPLKTYTYDSSGKLYAYSDSSLKNKMTNHYISCATDLCKIIEIKGDAVKVNYPVANGGSYTAWFRRDSFTYFDFSRDEVVMKFTAPKKITTYRWKNKETEFGYLEKGDVCYLLRGDINSSWLQLIYPVSGGYKLSWVKGDNIRDILWPPTKSIKVDIATKEINVGDTFSLKATIDPSNSYQGISWKSSNTSVATVSNGTVKGIDAGIATITAISGNKSAACTVTVKAPTKSITLDISSKEINVGESFAIKATINPSNSYQGVSWKSDDTSIAIVNNGIVKGVSAGITTITATSGSKSAKCTVTVVPIYDPWIELDEYELYLYVGETHKLTAIKYPEDVIVSDIVWTSDNDSVASVDQNGYVTAISAGECMIRAVYQNEYEAECYIVVPYEPWIEFDESYLDTIIDVSVHMNEDQVAEAETAGYDF